MVDPRYRPGRRRTPTLALLLDWAAGVLIGIVLTLIGAGLVSLFVDEGMARLGALVTTLLVTWPVGAALGVWLSAGRPLTGRRIAYALVASLVGGGLLMLPHWIDVESDLVRMTAGIAALVLTPAFARLGLGLARRQQRAG